jgi:hypothetical protein
MRCHQQFQKGQLACGEVQGHAGPAGAHAHAVELEVGHLENRLSAGQQVLGAARQRFEPGQQFFKLKGLAQVVVGPHAQAGDPLVQCA